MKKKSKVLSVASMILASQTIKLFTLKLVSGHMTTLPTRTVHSYKKADYESLKQGQCNLHTNMLDMATGTVNKPWTMFKKQTPN